MSDCVCSNVKFCASALTTFSKSCSQRLESLEMLDPVSVELASGIDSCSFPTSAKNSVLVGKVGSGVQLEGVRGSHLGC